MPPKPPQKLRNTPNPKVQNYLLTLLTHREYSTRELSQKLGRKFGNPRNWQTALIKIQQLGLQSDPRFAASFLRSHPHWGTLKLKQALQQHKLPADLIQRVLPTPATELQKIRHALKIKLQGAEIPTAFPARQKLAAFLSQRGFAADLIQQTLFNS